MKNNMELWEKVCETDPRKTKQVTFGRKYTAIDPYYQIEMLTKTFGAVGLGWGFEVVSEEMVEVISPKDQNVVAQVYKVSMDFWYIWGEKKAELKGLKEGVTFSSLSGKGKHLVDDDCFKKAITGCLT